MRRTCGTTGPSAAKGGDRGASEAPRKRTAYGTIAATPPTAVSAHAMSARSARRPGTRQMAHPSRIAAEQKAASPK